MNDLYSSPPKALTDAGFRKKIVISVVGVGQVGFRTCMAFGKAGYKIIALDIDKEKILKINNRKLPIEGCDMQEIPNFVDIVGSTEIPENVGKSDAVILCLPTPADNSKPDTAHLKSATREIAKGLKRGTVVVFESTVYPGIIESQIIPLMEEKGFKAGSDFGVAFVPERIDPGNSQFPIEKIPRVMGAIDKKSLEIAKALYESALESKVFPVSNIRTAEAVKLIENTFRDINIAFANELAMVLDGSEIDVDEAINAAKTKPFAFMPHYPGPGVGGDCIPVSPHWLMEYAKVNGKSMRLVDTARKINNRMPEYVVDKLESKFSELSREIKNSKILVLGLTYKPDINDVRNSPATKIVELLKDHGANVFAHDSIVGNERIEKEFKAIPADMESLNDFDALVLVTPHSDIKSRLEEITKNIRKDCVFFDTRNALKEKTTKSIYMGIGRQ